MYILGQNVNSHFWSCNQVRPKLLSKMVVQKEICLKKKTILLGTIARVFAEGRYSCAKFALFTTNFYFCNILRIICAWSETSFAQYSASYATSFSQKENSAKFAQNAIFGARTTSCIINKILTTFFFIFFEFT